MKNGDIMKKTNMIKMATKKEKDNELKILVMIRIFSIILTFASLFSFLMVLAFNPFASLFLWLFSFTAVIGVFLFVYTFIKFLTDYYIFNETR